MFGFLKPIFQKLQRDGNGSPVPVGNGILTTYNAVSSPLTLTATVITEIFIPDNGMEFSIDNCTTDLEISEDLAMLSYTTLPANTSRVIGVGGIQSIFVRSVAGGTLNFSIVTV